MLYVNPFLHGYMDEAGAVLIATRHVLLHSLLSVIEDVISLLYVMLRGICNRYSMRPSVL